MPGFIEDLWIITSDGIPLIEVFKNTNVNTFILSAYLSAIESFSKEVSGQELLSLGFGNKKLLITPCLEGNVYLVSQYSAKVKEKKIKGIFTLLTEFFEESYTIDDIQTWNGDISLFNKFKERINLYFQMYDL